MRELSAEDRALIDAAIAEGRVNRIEPGVGTMRVAGARGRTLGYRVIYPGIPIDECPVVWHNGARQNALSFRRPKGRSGKRGAPQGDRVARANKARAEKARAEYESMHKRGLTVDQMAAERGVAVQTIRQSLIRYGLKTRIVKKPKNCPERVARYRALVEEGLTIGEIAERLGVVHSTAWDNLRRYGLRARPGRPGRRPASREVSK